MVYSTVKAHRGQLEIQSEPGQGTRVRMRFPASEAAMQAQEAVPADRAEPSAGGLTVLLVDDDPLIQGAMQEVLEVLGHRVTPVLSGEAALAELAAGLRPDVVILDMNMPGLGGAGTLSRLRALNPTLPVLLATGRVDEYATEVAAAYPFVTLLSKPFSIRELQRLLAPLG
jgi:CheY-like chemotaxis protein